MRSRAYLACGVLVVTVVLLSACGRAPTRRPVVVALATATKTVVPSPTPTLTTTATPTLTSSVTPTATPTMAPTARSIATPSVSSTAPPTLASTARPMETATDAPTPAVTATSTEQPSSTPSPTPTATQTPTPTPTQEPLPTEPAPPVISNDLIGTWREDSGYHWRFREDGTYCLGGAPPALCEDPVTTGIFWLEGTQLVIRDTGGRSVCGPGTGDPVWDGVYMLFLSPNEIFSLMVVHDPCLSRTELVTRSPWSWVSR